MPAEGISEKGRRVGGMSGRSNLSMMGHKTIVQPKQFWFFLEFGFKIMFFSEPGRKQLCFFLCLCLC